MRPMTVALIAILSIALHGTSSPAGANPAGSTSCPRIISTQRVMSSERVNQATKLLYKVILVNVGQGSMADESGSEAVMFLPPRARVDLDSLALPNGLTVVSGEEFDTSIRWDLELASGSAAISLVTVIVQDKPIQDGAPLMIEDGEEPDLFLYVNGECGGGTAP